MKEESGIPFLRSTSVMKNTYTEMRYQRAYSGADSNNNGWPEENSKYQTSENIVSLNTNYEKDIQRLQKIEYDHDREMVNFYLLLKDK